MQKNIEFSFVGWKVIFRGKIGENWKTEKNGKKNWKKLKPILNIIYELCQHLGSLRSLWKAPETKILGHFKWLSWWSGSIYKKWLPCTMQGHWSKRSEILHSVSIAEKILFLYTLVEYGLICQWYLTRDRQLNSCRWLKIASWRWLPRCG